MTMQVYVCNYCQSPRVSADAFYNLNTGEVQTYDDTFCHDCESSCKVTEVEVADDFDVETDFYRGD